MIEAFRVDPLQVFYVEGIPEQGWFVQALYHDSLSLRTQFRHGHAFLIGNIAEERTIATGDGNETDAPIVLVRPQLGAGEQRHGVDELVKVVNEDGAVLFKKRVPCGSGAGELPRVGNDVALCSFRSSRAKHQYRFAIGNRLVQCRSKTLRLLGRSFDVSRDDIDFRALGLIGEIVGSVEDNLVAPAGAQVEAELALSAGVYHQVHHAAALKDAADVAGAEIFRQLAAPDSQLRAHRNEAHAIRAQKFYPCRFGGFGQLP